MRAAWLGVLLLAASPGSAQTPSLGGFGAQDSGKPIGIEASQGVEWQQNNRLYIARGNARATRSDDSVYADTLYAFYRAATPQTVSTAQHKGSDPFSGGSTDIYRLEADGNVRFTTPTQTVYGDHAVYDVDQAVLVVTGKNLKMVTLRDQVTARDALEWYDRKQLGVARGNALAVRDDRRVHGDILTSTMEKSAKGPAHIGRIDAHGNVVVASSDQIARGDAGVYNLDTGIATLQGHVKLTRGDNELRGNYAVVDMNKHVSRMLTAPPSVRPGAVPRARVEGLLVPRRKPDQPQKP